MWFWLLLIAATLTGAPASAQDPTPSSATGPVSSPEDGQRQLPVSLDRIREGLSHAPAKPLLSGVERQPDFKIEVEERRRLEEILETLDFKTGPAPPGGLYGYDQQRRLFNPVDHPLMQPYAAFSSGELLTIAIQNLALKYLGGRIADAVSDFERQRAEEAAHAEVARAVAEYCAAQPERGVSLSICTSPPTTR